MMSMKRMFSVLICLAFLAAMSASAAYAGESAEIELVDGSVLYGEIVSLKNGIYTIKSDTMGSFVISKSKIRAIRYGSRGVSKNSRNNSLSTDQNVDIQGMQQSLIADEDIFNMILSLQNDPKIQEVLNDPEIMKAVQSGDIQSLMSNPKFMELLNHPEIKAINNKIVK